MKNFLVGTSFLLLLWLGAGTARAQDVGAGGAADALVDEGLDLRERGQDEEALARFRAAHELTPTPRILAQIALAEMALQQWLSAAGHLEDAMAATSPWIAEHRAVLEDALARIDQHLGRLEVVSDAPDASLFIGGEPVGALPLAQPLRAEPGEVSFQVRAPGRAEVERSVTLVAGRVTRVELTLPPDGAAEEGGAERAEAEPDSGGAGISVPGLTLLVAGGLVVAAGGALLGVAFAEKAALESPDGMPEWTESEQSRADAVPVMAASGEVALAVGAAALVLGVVLLVVDGGSERAEAALRRGFEARF